ncbi:VUT family protein [Candidatus Parcubacteria bacterium]|nr:MAG: VUT family protein [Candidatus Parcubacteria bacterium]
MSKNKINIGILSCSVYVAAQLIANVLSVKIVLLPLVNLAVDGGTIIYPVTFTLRDFVHKTWGKKNARQVVVIAGLLNLVMVFFFWLVGKLPSDPSWANQEAYRIILLPVFRIVIASIAAQILSELVDTEIFSVIYKKVSDTLAVLVSNFVSLLVDSFIFSFAAFWGDLPLVTVLQIMIANILIKFIISIISVPSIKLVPRTVDFNEI